MENKTLKNPSEYYNVRMMFNMTEEQKEKFLAGMESREYTSPQRYFREVLVEGKRIKQTKVLNAVKLVNLSPSQDEEFKTQLKKMGTNINQAVKRINSFITGNDAECDCSALKEMQGRLLWYLGRIRELCSNYDIKDLEEEEIEW